MKYLACLMVGLVFGSVAVAAAQKVYAREEQRALAEVCHELSRVADSCCRTAEKAALTAQQCVGATLGARSMVFTDNR